MIKYPRTQGPVGAAPARGHCVKVPEAVKERSQPQGFPPRMIDTCQAPSLLFISRTPKSGPRLVLAMVLPHGLFNKLLDETIYDSFTYRKSFFIQ